MTTQFPPSNLPAPMQPYGRALENSVLSTEGAQANTRSIIGTMRQSVASNYGLGGTLTDDAGVITNKVYTSLQNNQASPAASQPLQRSWTSVGAAIDLTSPAFTSNVALGVAVAVQLAITGGVAGGNYAHWIRVNVSGGVTGNKMISRTDYPQELFYWDAVPASSTITLRLQVWGFIENPDHSIVDGTIGTSSIRRISSSLRAIALV